MSFYLDHNATTPMCEGAIDAMTIVQRTTFGNASSVHAEGQAAREALEAARRSIAEMIGCKPTELYFTSGGTEANNWVLCGVLENESHMGLLVSPVEHKSLLKATVDYGWLNDRLRVDAAGLVNLEFLEHTLDHSEDDHVCLVSVMLANNETGVIQPIRAISDVVKNERRLRARDFKRSILHTDACQAFGKIPINVDKLGIDLMTLSAHKIGGPKGVGALYVREGIEFDAMIVGGHQEHEKRAGTENIAGAMGFCVAAVHRLGRLKDYNAAVTAHNVTLLTLLRGGLPEMWLNGADAMRLPNTLNVGFRGVDSDALVLMLSERGIMVSNGSACEAGSLEGSHVLEAMGQSEDECKSAIRFSFSDDLPDGAIEIIAERVIESVNALRSMEEIPL